MVMISYEAFLKETEMRIREYLPDSYRESKVDVISLQGNNETVFEGLSITCGEDSRVPILKLKNFYKQYCLGTSLEDVWREMAYQYTEIQRDQLKNSDLDFSYQMIRDKLMIAVCNAEENRELLKKVPHERREDLALIFRICLKVSHEVTGTALVSYHHLNTWKIREEQLKKDAWESMQHHSIPVFERMGSLICCSIEALRQESETGIEGCIPEQYFDLPIYILTNEEGLYGAAYMFDSQRMSQIAEQLDGNLIVLPSSTHEVIILKENEAMDLEPIREMVRDINANEVAPEEKLSDEIYRFDRDTGCVQVISEPDLHPEMTFHMQ